MTTRLWNRGPVLFLLLLTASLVFHPVSSLDAQPSTEHPLSKDLLTWRPLGPTATGGRVVDIAVDPNDVHTIYVAAASGGLWKTTNNGTTWKCIFENEGTLSIGDIAVDPQNPDTLWVGTGEANNQRSAFWGDGIYKSTDGGKTWTNMGLKDSHHIGRIVVDPTDSDTVYVAALGHLYTSNEQRGLFKTSDGGASWEHVLSISPKVGVVDVVINPKYPSILYAASYERLRRAWDFQGAGPGSAIYKSDDAGETWEKLTGGLPTGNLGRIGLDIYPENPDIVYATVSNQNLVTNPQQLRPVEEKEGGIYSTPFGFDVKLTDDAFEVVSIESNRLAARSGLRKQDRIVRIGGAAINNTDQLKRRLNSLKPGDQLTMDVKRQQRQVTLRLTVPADRRQQVGGEIYRSEDGGQTWQKQNRRPVGGQPAYYYGQIRIDPTNDQRLYLLSVPMYKSDDGGKTWTGNGARSVHVDHHALWINPDNPNHLLLGNDGGFHISYDRCETWDYVFNLPLSQFYAIGVDMQQPYHVYGGLQDNGSYGGPSRSRQPSGIGRFEWYRVGGGDGFYVQVDPNDADIIISESQFGFINRLNRKTGQRTSIRPPQSDPNGPRDRYNWNSPILMSKHDSRVIYFAGNKLFKSFNYGDDWQVISPDLTTADPVKISGNVPHCTITTIAESALDKNVLLVGTDDGNVQWSDDGGKNWTNLANRFPFKPQNWWATRVELSHHDINTAYVSFSAFREDDFRPFVFVTRDRGKTWQSIAGDLPDGPINVIKEDPRNPNTLYLGSEFAAYVSVNAGQDWIALNKGLPRVSVQDLLIHPRDRDLVIGTHGRGIFVLDDITVFQEWNDQIAAKPAHLFSMRPAIQWRSISRLSISGDRRVLAPNPPRGAVISYYLESAVEEEEISLEILDSSGKRVARLNPKRTAGIHRARWAFRSAGRQARRPTAAITPGSYTVVLKVRDQEYRQTLVVKRDPIVD